MPAPRSPSRRRANSEAPQDLPCGLRVVERNAAVADDLNALVALAREQHDVAAVRFAQRELDRALAVGLDHDRALRRQPSLDLADDRERILAARVVRGDER